MAPRSCHAAPLIRDLWPLYLRRRALVRASANTTHSADTPHRSESTVLNRIYTPSVATARTLLMALSVVAMALAGSAGGHWG